MVKVMTRPKILVFAYSQVGAVCLEQLLSDGANVVCVYTHDDDPTEEIWFRSVKEIAKKNGIETRVAKPSLPEELEYIKKLDPELVLSFYYRALIPKSVLDIPKLGAYNIHGALLPRYRGRACVNWAVLNGETVTGATLHVMTEAADKGDIADSEAVSIEFTDTGHDVFLKVTEAARKIIERTLPALENGSVKLTPQDESKASYFGRRRPEDGEIDWNKSAVEIYNLIRSVTHPFPGAFTELDGRKCMIWKAEVLDGIAQPKEIVSRSPLVIGTGKGLLRILDIEEK